MAKRKNFRGITIKFGADTTSIGKALQDVNKQSNAIGAELREVNRALKFDPSNAVLLQQKYDLVTKSIAVTSEKLKGLESVQEQVTSKFKAGEIGEQAFRSFQREIENTRIKLNRLTREKDEIKNIGKEFESVADKTKKLDKALEEVSDSTKELKDDVYDSVQGIVDLGVKAIAVIGAAAVAAISKSLKIGAGFEEAMSHVAATMGITAATNEYQKLSEAAKEAGATTKFSSTDAAEALNYLALAGYDVTKQIAALPVVLDLAAAGNIELANASDMVTDSMSALGIATSELGDFSDQLAKAAQKSNTSISQLGDAITTVGGTAKQLVGGTVELNTALGILADNAIKGSEGGTALRQILLNLTAPTDTAAKKMQELGVSAFDAQGNLKPLNEIFAQLDKALEGMNDQTRSASLSEIFDSRQLKSAEALLANYGDRWDELSEQIANSEGAAKQMATTMADNLKGDLDELNSSLEAIGITVYESFQEPFRKAVSVAVKELSLLNENMTDGEMSESLNRIAEGFANLTKTVVEFSVNKGLPAVIDGFEWISKNGTFIKSTVVAIGAAFLTWKVVGVVNNARVAIVAYQKAVELAATKQQILNATMNSAVGAFGITAAVAALTFGITAFVTAMKNSKDAISDVNKQLKKYEESMESAKQSAESTRVSAELEITLLKEKAGKYEELRKQAGRTVEEENLLKNLAIELQRELPSHITLIDEKTGAYRALGDSIDDVIAKERASLDLGYLKSLAEEAKTQEKELQEAFEKAQKEYEDFINLEGKYSGSRSVGYVGYGGSHIEYADKLEADVKATKSAIEENQKLIDDYMKAYENYLKESDTSDNDSIDKNSKIESQKDILEESLKDEAEAYIATLKYQYDMGIITAKEYYTQLSALNEQYYADSEDDLDKYRRYNVEVYKGLERLRSSNNTEKSKLKDLLEEEKNKLQDINKERQRTIDLEKALQDLENAKKNKSLRTYYADRGFVDEINKKDVQAAENKIQEINTQKQVDAIDKMIKSLDKNTDNTKVNADAYLKNLDASKIADFDTSSIQNIINNMSSVTDQLSTFNMDKLTLPSTAAISQVQKTQPINVNLSFSIGDINVQGNADTDTIELLMQELDNKFNNEFKAKVLAILEEVLSGTLLQTENH
ncbi:MAG: phage tail tape measure protein [Clostridiaceae bacterium]|nr:phage tail tape measure protein [Clostridiaceae bacterium]